MLCQLMVGRGQGPWEELSNLNLHVFEHGICEAEDGSVAARRRTLVDFKHAARCWVQAQLQHSPVQTWG